MSGMHDLNGPRKTATGPKREPAYWCNRCTVQRWRSGGVSELGRHQAVHGGAEISPSFDSIDHELFVLGDDGKRKKEGGKFVRPSLDKTGWVRSRPVIVAPPLKHKEASR